MVLPRSQKLQFSSTSGTSACTQMSLAILVGRREPGENQLLVTGDKKVHLIVLVSFRRLHTLLPELVNLERGRKFFSTLALTHLVPVLGGGDQDVVAVGSREEVGGGDEAA